MGVEDLPRLREAAEVAKAAAAAEGENGARNKLAATVAAEVAVATAVARVVEEIRRIAGQAAGRNQRETGGTAERGLVRGAADEVGGKASFNLARPATT